MNHSSKKGYSLFYALLKNHPQADKDEIVLTYTEGRTCHLHEMKASEYREMCNALAASSASAQVEQLKKARSKALYWIQRLGVDTLDWDAINAFVLSPRIAGKEFKALSVAELQDLHRKLRAIHDKGGIRNLPAATAVPEQAEPAKETVRITVIPNQFKS